MKTFFRFLNGFVSSMILLSCTNISTYGHGLTALIPYIGPSILCAIIYVGGNIHRDKIEELEKKIKELENGNR